MELNINEWLDLAEQKLKIAFGKNLLFVGLQGSFGRGDATPESDIDLVVILKDLSFEDLEIYRSVINDMPYNEKSCGFISGKNEIQKWSKTDLFQFFYDTKSLFGNLEDIIQPPSISDIKKSIKTSSENLYHSVIRSFVHSDDYVNDMQNLSKMAFFILQAKYFVETNHYIPTKKQLLEYLSGYDKEILDICINKETVEIEVFYKNLIKWSSNNI